jgi:hypothetical protein
VTFVTDAAGRVPDPGEASIRTEETTMPPETLPLLLATLAAYVTLGVGTLFRVRRRARMRR